MIGRLSLPLAVASASIAAALATPACHKEAVIPFPDTGSPCAASTTTMKIDCSEFPQTTCAVPSTTCVQTSYGCRDGGYFEQTDDSLCATDAAPPDVSLIGSFDGSTDAAEDEGEGGSSPAEAGADEDGG